MTLVWLYVSWAIVLAGAELAAVLEFGPARATAPAAVRREAVALHSSCAPPTPSPPAPAVEASALIARELRVDLGIVADAS